MEGFSDTADIRPLRTVAQVVHCINPEGAVFILYDVNDILCTAEPHLRFG